MTESTVRNRGRRHSIVALTALALAVLAPACSKSLVLPPTAGATPAVGAIIPEAECYSDNDGGIYFGYTNDNPMPVVIPANDGNHLSGDNPDDNPMLTTLFAPGHVAHAFWAYFGSNDPLEWSLTGPDGVTRTASVSSLDEFPVCESVITTPGDSRQPVLDGTGTLSDDGLSVTFDVTLTGVPTTSVCNSAFQAEPALVGLGDGSALPTGYETTRTTTVALHEPAGAPTNVAMLAALPVVALVVDQCSYDGTTVTSWPASTAVSTLSFVTYFCAFLDDQGTLTTGQATYCEGPPQTGGSPARPH